MPKLNDTQTILLSTASQRDDLSFYPLPGAFVRGGARVDKAIATLIKAGFAEERGEGAVFATVAGLAAIGIEAGGDLSGNERVVEAPSRTRVTKSSLLLDLLQREQGATIDELIAATGWLPHTTRAALTGLRKRGHIINRAKRDGVTCYTAEQAA